VTWFCTWHFRPAEGRDAAFREAYGPGGPWVALFRRAEGYVGTELAPLHDPPGWYRTTDRWASEAAHRAFRERHAAEYAALDAACAVLTAAERLVAASLATRRGDITTFAVDAIVNAANEPLWPGGGVCGAIHRAAGPALAEACREVAPCPTGEARLTPGFALPARHVIHAVGPVWHGGDRGEPALLAGAYRAALVLARAHGLRRLAFPAISTGVYGYPLEPACAIAVDTARRFLDGDPGSVAEITFACVDERALGAYTALGVPGLHP
jgi:O-acetyl-ADP-ribose deacetylase (regulator of RNase III)